MANHFTPSLHSFRQLINVGLTCEAFIPGLALASRLSPQPAIQQKECHKECHKYFGDK